MNTVTIYGASDDLIEVDGAIKEEFNPPYDRDEERSGSLLCFSDGSVLRVTYTKDGIWRITLEARGSAEYSKSEAVSSEDDNYSDRVTLRGDLRWVVFAERGQLVKATD